MNEKNSSPVAKLIGNRLFISLLVFAVVIVVFSAIRNTDTAKPTDTEVVLESEENLQVISEKDEPKDVEVSSEILETMLPVDEEPEVEEEKQPIKYNMPLSGELQRDYSGEELAWDETMQDWRNHRGVDIASNEGDEVDTAAPGVVVESKKDEMYGYMVVVDHQDGVTTVYKNLESVVVETGDTLDEGQMIGKVGNSSAFEMAQNPHLHFEVLKDDAYVNPLEFIK